MTGRLIRRLPWLGAAVVLGAVEVPASTISVQSMNSASGEHALRLTVSKTCVDGDLTLPDGAISTDPAQVPCGTLTAGDVDVVSGSVRFRAGTAIALRDGFSVAAEAELTTEIGPRVRGAAYLRDESPAAETEYYVRFSLDPDNLTLSELSHRFELLVAYDVQGNREFVLGVTYNPAQAERRLWAEAYETSGTQRTTEGLCELALATGWHAVEAQWKASTGVDGDLVVIVDDQVSQSLASCLGLGGGLDNAGGEISAVEWGCRDPSSASLGSVDLDDFDSRRHGPVGSP